MTKAFSSLDDFFNVTWCNSVWQITSLKLAISDLARYMNSWNNPCAGDSRSKSLNQKNRVLGNKVLK